MAKPEVLTFDTPFTTESGFVLEKPQIAYQSWGSLNENRDNVVFICHALTGNTEADEWFGGLFGKDKPFDPDRHFILCPNILGSCYGSTGPTSINPETGKPYQADFPNITIRDIVRFNQQLLDDLEINGIELMVGGSLGGMTALEFAVMDDRIERACVMGMGKAHTAWAIGISEAQRMAIYADAHWNDGFYDEKNPPKKGLAAARAMAMITYRTPENYEQKFGRDVHPQKDVYQVESYLNYQGQKLVERFDANTYVTLSKAMDFHDVARGRGTFKEILRKLDIPVLVIGFTSDKLYPIEEQQELAQLIPNSRLAELESPYGHDAFLIEFDQLNVELNNFYHSLTKIKS
ncbi:homoserine O-acetyltransferase MetX [Gracilimonas mengyeensis]|uniref:Homoserine O-acetyltransferase n=1 Tax=Gracilimonas mengyeensis TaxID=1302730 RepID=A0A521C011_9BACT|nr:homoserine O-acetyltransferase [Gracilimonas mengyeensis]SMO52789.1 homoserine O-acetyltransferase [Gracilimonas mengyeensis]